MDRFGVRSPRLKAMARTPEIPPVKTGNEESPVSTDDIDWQGAKLRKLADQEFSALGVAADAVGVFAAEVPEGSAAFDAGLRQGDLIQHINDQAVRNAKEFLDAVTAAPKEQTLNLKIIRNQRTETLNVNTPSQAMTRLKSFIFAALLWAPLAAIHADDVANLRCEYLENPLGIDVVKPRLSWVIEEGNQKPESRDQKQTAYQILVASSEQLLKRDQGDLWDSGKVESDRSVAILYGGPALESGRICHWRAARLGRPGSRFPVERNWVLDDGETQARGLVGPVDRRAARSSGTDLDSVVITVPPTARSTARWRWTSHPS